MAINRRQLFKGLGYGVLSASFNPFKILIENALASTTDTNNFAEFENNYFSLFMQGGTPRWMFDLILKTDQTKDLNGQAIPDYIQEFNHPMVFTGINSNDRSPTKFHVTPQNLSPSQLPSGNYNTFEFENYYLPPIWSSFSDLLNNWLTIRGIDSIPFHGAAVLQTHNIGTSQFSLQSFVGDNEIFSNFGPIQNNLQTNFIHKAKKEISSTKIRRSENINIIKWLMKAFVGKKLSSNRKLLLDAYQDSIIRGLKGATKNSGKTNLTSEYAAILNSKKVFNNNLDAIIELYPEAFNKYRGIIIKSLNTSIETEQFQNIDNNDLYNSWTNFCLQNVPNNPSIEQYYLSTPDVKTTGLALTGLGMQDMYVIDKNGMVSDSNSYLNGIISSSNIPVIELDDSETPDQTYISVRDFRRNLVGSGGNYDKLSSSFALSEVLIKENLSNNLITNIGGASVGNDGHSTGSIVKFYAFTKYYHSLLSCLKEIKTGIGANKFSKSLFQISSEFNRTPRLSEGGSDHASTNVISYFGGMFTNGPYFGGKARVGLNDSIYGANFGENQGIPTDQKSDYLSVYDSVAAIFGTRASNRNEDQLAFRKVEGTWVFKDELVNILIEDE